MKAVRVSYDVTGRFNTAITVSHRISNDFCFHLSLSVNMKCNASDDSLNFIDSFETWLLQGE